MHSNRTYRAALTGLLLMAVIAAPVFAAKKPKPPRPDACLDATNGTQTGQICIVELRWDPDLAYPGSGFTMFILGTLENRTGFPIEDISLSFPLQSGTGAFIRTATADLTAALPPGGRWDFRAYVGQRGEFQLVENDVVVTESAELGVVILRRSVKNTFHFQPVFDHFEGRVKKRWMQTHGPGSGT